MSALRYDYRKCRLCLRRAGTTKFGDLCAECERLAKRVNKRISRGKGRPELELRDRVAVELRVELMRARAAAGLPLFEPTEAERARRLTG